jgi:SPP1 gp7 family putative phage head morphogenesis protein
VATVNEELFDKAVGHSIDLTRYSNGTVKRMITLLNKSDADLFEKLQSAIERLPADSFTVKRLESMLKSVREINEKAYKQVFGEFQQDLFEFTDYELGYQAQLFKDTLPTVVSIASVAPAQVYAAAMAQPFQGRILSDWAKSLETGRLQRIKDGIAIGFTNNETVSQIVQRIRGTRALNYKDGIIDIDRRHAEAVVRTAINHTSQIARDEFYADNADLIKGLRWTATLDSRTSPICQALDGKVFPLKGGQRPPAHWNCRSTMTPVIKSWRELGIDEDDLTGATRASMNGQVPADMTYQQWLQKQSREVQDDILGKGKADIFRSGVPVTNFVNRNGVELTLAQLKEKYGAAVPVITPQPPAPPVDKIPALAKIVPTKTIREAEELATRLLEPNNKAYPKDPRDGGEIVKYRGFTRDNQARKRNEVYGQAVLKGIDKSSVDIILEAFRDIQAEMDKLGLPRLRAITPRAGAALASMGDGVLNISPKVSMLKDNETVRTWKRGDSQEFIRGKTDGIPWTAEKYFPTRRDSIVNTLWHESAHHIHQLYKVNDFASYMRPPLETYLNDLYRSIKREDRIHPTQYSKENSKEWFAESWSLFKMGRGDLIDLNLLDLFERLERGEDLF